MSRTLLGTQSLLVLLLLTVGCRGADDTRPPDDRLVVVTSIFPVGDLVQRLAGEDARVEVLLPPGASPATFDVTPQQLRDLAHAGLFIMIGGGLDEWLSRLPEAAGGAAPLVRLSDGIPLMEEEEGHEHEAGSEEHGSGNPHIWLDPVLVRDRIVPRLSAALEAALPAAAGEIRENARLLDDSLTALDGEIHQALDPLNRRSFISTHSAWSYFAVRYGLVEVGVIHAHPGQDPSSREMAHLIGVARENQIDCLFTEPQLGEVAARALATELSLPTCMLDPLGGPSVQGRDGYFQLLRFNTNQFVQGLQKGSG